MHVLPQQPMWSGPDWTDQDNPDLMESNHRCIYNFLDAGQVLTHIISARVYTCNYRSSDATPSIHMTQIDKPVNSKRPPKSPDNWSDAKEHVHIVKTAVKYVVIRHGIRSPPLYSSSCDKYIAQVRAI